MSNGGDQGQPKGADSTPLHTEKLEKQIYAMPLRRCTYMILLFGYLDVFLSTSWTLNTYIGCSKVIFLKTRREEKIAFTRVYFHILLFFC